MKTLLIVAMLIAVTGCVQSAATSVYPVTAQEFRAEVWLDDDFATDCHEHRMPECFE